MSVFWKKMQRGISKLWIALHLVFSHQDISQNIILIHIFSQKIINFDLEMSLIIYMQTSWLIWHLNMTKSLRTPHH
jgi:hypothetical protein